MKLLRYGPKGQERPGLLDGKGRIRDLSGKIKDIDGDQLSPQRLHALSALDPEALPLVDGDPRLGPPVTNYVTKEQALSHVATTGTPPGVGMGQKPEPQYLKPGDVMRLGVDKLGQQQQTLVAWKEGL